uniref:BLOC-1-related complex subunit 8 n=1 Tax=Sinocyclocheilus anshuiensis TaxID=1608454 RepID=A0A671SHA5_9TELE
MEDQEMQLKVKRVTDKFTESMYVLANEPSIALYRLQEHVRRSLPELVQHKTDMQSWEEQSQGAIYTVEYACSAVKSMTNSSLYFKNIDGLVRQAISLKYIYITSLLNVNVTLAYCFFSLLICFTFNLLTFSVFKHTCHFSSVKPAINPNDTPTHTSVTPP